MVCEGWNDAGTGLAHRDNQRRGTAGKRKRLGRSRSGILCRSSRRGRRSDGGHQCGVKSREMGDEERRGGRGQEKLVRPRVVFQVWLGYRLVLGFKQAQERADSDRNQVEGPLDEEAGKSTREDRSSYHND